MTGVLVTAKWDRRFLEVAHLVATWSKDPSTKVGAVAVRERRILSTGFNGFPRYVWDTLDRLEDRDTRLMMTTHAETNLLAHAAEAGVSLKRSTVYCTFPPCSQCAGHLINAGVVRIVLPQTAIPYPQRWVDSFQQGSLMLGEAGVRVDLIPYT